MQQRSFVTLFRFLCVAGACLSLFCAVFNCAAQSRVPKGATDTLLVNELIDAARKQPDPDSALRLYERPLQLSLAGNYTAGIIKTYRLMAYVYFLKSDYAQAIVYNRKAMPFCTRPMQRAVLLHTIGNVYSQEGDYVKASEHFYAALSELKNDHLMDAEQVNVYLDLYTSLAILNSDLKHEANELYYLTEAEHLAREHKAYYKLVSVLLNKATYYQERKKTDSAMLILRECEAYSREYHFQQLEADIDETMGTVYLDSGKFEKAIECLKAGIRLSDNPLNERHNYILIYSSYAIADALYQLGKYKVAEETIIPAIKKAESLNIKGSITEAFATVIKICKATGQYKKATEYMDSLTIIKDSLTGIEKAAAINQIETKYKTAEKDKQLSQNQLQLSQNQLMIAQQGNKIARKNIWMVSIGASLVLLMVILVGVYLNSVNKQKSLEKENKISVLKAAIEGGDGERSRIARELHDGIGGMLGAAMMRFSSMHHENPEITKTVAYKDAMGILREMGDEIRKTAHNLMPEVLLKQCLFEAIRLFCNSVQNEGTLKVDFQCYVSFKDISPNYKLNVYRIVQELIKNVTIHSAASRVLVQLLQTDDKLIVSVEDNGRGFKVSEGRGGLGLENVRTRVSSMDGIFTLESEPGKGTTVIIELRLAELKKAEDVNSAGALT